MESWPWLISEVIVIFEERDLLSIIIFFIFPLCIIAGFICKKYLPEGFIIGAPMSIIFLWTLSRVGFNAISNYRADKVKIKFLDSIVSEFEFEIPESGIKEVPEIRIRITIDYVKRVCPKNWIEKIFFNTDKFRKRDCNRLYGRLIQESNNSSSYIFCTIENSDLFKKNNWIISKKMRHDKEEK
jgi:hypothetical protein